MKKVTSRNYSPVLINKKLYYMKVHYLICTILVLTFINFKGHGQVYEFIGKPTEYCELNEETNLYECVDAEIDHLVTIECNLDRCQVSFSLGEHQFQYELIEGIKSDTLDGIYYHSIFYAVEDDGVAIWGFYVSEKTITAYSSKYNGETNKYDKDQVSFHFERR